MIVRRVQLKRTTFCGSTFLNTETQLSTMAGSRLDTNVFNKLRTDLSNLETGTHEMVEGLHEYEDLISQELEETERIENLFHKIMNEIDDLERKELMIENLEQKHHSNEIDQKEREIAEDIQEELEIMQHDINTAQLAIQDLRRKMESGREEVTKLGELEEKINEAEDELMEDEEGMISRLARITGREQVTGYELEDSRT